MKKHIKKIWKFIARIALRIYAWDFALHIDNNPNIEELKSERGAYSQFGQDIFALEHAGRSYEIGAPTMILQDAPSGEAYSRESTTEKPETASKFFVDIGGNEPIRSSNTYLLEKMGWDGIALEPQKRLRDKWPGARKTPCLPYAIGPENKIITFVEGSEEEHGLAGVDGFNKCEDDSRKIEVEQRRLTDVLKERSIHRVDYLSVDVEGYEMNVLKGIDFAATDIRMLSVENDIGFKWIPFIGKKIGSELGNKELRNFIKSKGYSYVGRVMCDDFFIKNS